ncbi:MAG: suppressor of fused domain protein [Planctomycetes bacterium]|nr:suppressor of fused domain protein [Planctomycetota bacterium]
MEFAPVDNDLLARPGWTYATNGMSERRMPCQEEPHGDPSFRTELVVHTASRAPWVVDLLAEMARYPFVHKSGFAPNQTIPVGSSRPRLWDGYLLLIPPTEPEEINPLAVDIGIGEDFVFHLQVIGLKRRELGFAMEHGGPEFVERHLASLGTGKALREILYLDRLRDSLL